MRNYSRRVVNTWMLSTQMTVVIGAFFFGAIFFPLPTQAADHNGSGFFGYITCSVRGFFGFPCISVEEPSPTDALVEDNSTPEPSQTRSEVETDSSMSESESELMAEETIAQRGESSAPTIQPSVTHVTNEYITNPTTIVREVVKETVRESRGGGGSSVNTSDFVSKELFYAQTGSTQDSISDKVGNLSSALSESVETNLLTVTGNTTLAALTLSGAFRDTTGSAGTSGMILQTTGTSTRWVATSTLGIGGGGGAFTSSGGFTTLTNTNDSVGIGTTSPSYKLDVTGFINTDQYSGYKQAGNTILYASSTNFSTLVGDGAGADLKANGIRNTFLGFQAGNRVTSADDNLFVGYQSGLNNTTGYQNTFLGAKSGLNNTTGQANIFIGQYSGGFNTTGFYNIFIGPYSGLYNETGSYNTFIGLYSGSYNTTGYSNAFVGLESGAYNTTGYSNTFIGRGSGVDNTTGLQNTFLGRSSGLNNTTGSNNILLGFRAGNNLTTGSNNIVIGNDIAVPNATGDDQLNIGNTIYGDLSSGNVGIGTTTPSSKLTVAGTVAFTGLSNDGTGYYACVNTNTGELSTSTTACGASSERFKESIKDLTYGMDTILDLRPVSFEWRENFITNGTPQIGLIAEEVATTVPEVIGYGPDGEVQNLDYAKLVAVVINALKEVWAKVTGHEERIEALEEENESLKAEIDAIKMELDIDGTNPNSASQDTDDLESDDSIGSNSGTSNDPEDDPATEISEDTLEQTDTNTEEIAEDTNTELDDSIETEEEEVNEDDAETVTSDEEEVQTETTAEEDFDAQASEDETQEEDTDISEESQDAGTGEGDEEQSAA